MSYQDVWGTGASSDLFNGAGTMSLVPLYAAVRLITDQFAATPLHGYRDAGGVPRQMPQDPQILTPAVATTSRSTWKTQCITGLLTRGNAVGLYGGYDQSGWPTSIVWVPTGDVQCDDENPAAPIYWYLGRRLEPGTFVHIPWLTLPGKVWGLSPLGMFKNLWETGAAAQLLARNFYDSGGVPSGHFKNTARELSPEAAAEMKTKFKIAVSGRDVLVTGNDWAYNSIGLPADQLAFVASLKLTATQIASIYGLSPEDIGGEAASGLQYSTVEMNQIKLSTNTMRPWYTRVEDALAQATPRGQFLRFDLDALVRADLKSRMESHEIATRIGGETQDEMRAKEAKPPLTPDEFKLWQTTYKPVATAPVQARKEQA
jgi:HK97 family phage portal protein